MPRYGWIDRDKPVELLNAAPGSCGRRLGLFLFLFLGFFFVTVVSFGHIELLVIVEPQLGKFH
jgi:hypothetical protein